ncbi:uncharacterized membrane protein YidH (DUF202 family) [Nocardia sp. GAS34]|uniref:DUF4386 domain-containing protein n=1 Tax=unclassified Nocardia TaxID=2637762 RepID=UPI003D251323
MSAPTTTRTTRTALPVLAATLAFAAFTVAYVAVNSGVPHPDATGSAVLAYNIAHRTLLEVGATLLLISAAPLAVTATLLYRAVSARMRGVPPIAMAGGLLASGALVVSALFTWAGARLTGTASPDLARAVADLGFVSGGAAYAAGVGLLVLGVAVPALLGRLLPRALAWSGLVIAAAGALSALGLIVPALQFLFPIVRFGGLLWLLITAIVLYRRR